MKVPRLTSLIAAILSTFFLASDAQAATVTVGSPLTGPYASTITCGDPQGCTWANIALAEAGANVTSPVSGAIVRWRIADNYSGAFRLRVLRPAGSQYTGVSTSVPVEANGTTSVTFPADLPIKAGDLIAVDYEDGRHLATASVAGSGFSLWAPALGEFATGTATSLYANLEILFNADVQPAPTITSISPASSSIRGGATVTITGTDFEGASAVVFGPTPANGFSVDSESQITAVVPARAVNGRVDVTVTTVAGSSAKVDADLFDYTACVVPRLKGKKLRPSKRKLRAGGCRVGKVRKGKGVKARTGKVVKQSPKPGKILAPGSRVNVKLG